jgi:hypothetical protein
MKAAVQALAKDDIQELNEVQISKWEKDKILVCPHGRLDWDLYQFNLHSWTGARSDEDFGGDGSVILAGGYEANDRDSGPAFCSCHHEPYTSFWPPEDMTYEWT